MYINMRKYYAAKLHLLIFLKAQKTFNAAFKVERTQNSIVT